MKVIPKDHVVSMVELGRWNWDFVRKIVEEFKTFGIEIESYESSGWFKRTFVLVGDPIAVVRIERHLGRLGKDDKLGRGKARLALCVAIAALPLIVTAGVYAGDGDHVGGLTSRTRQEQTTNLGGTRDWATGGWYYGPDILSWEYLSRPFTNVGPGTSYDGGFTDDIDTYTGGDRWGGSMEGRGA